MDVKELEQRSLEELLELYLARFGQQFPIMLCRTMNDEKVKEIIIKNRRRAPCVQAGEEAPPPFEFQWLHRS